MKMWKYVSRRFKDTVERGASFFEAKNASNLTSLHCKTISYVKPLSARAGRQNRCWNSLFGDGKNKTNNRKWNCEYLHNTWIGAITWSSAIIIGWYASQLLCFSSRRYQHANDKIQKKAINNIQPIVPLQYMQYNGAIIVNSGYKQQSKQPAKNQVVTNCTNNTPEIYNSEKISSRISFVSNDIESNHKNDSDAPTSSSSINDAADKFIDVLSGIENKLGLAAIENGDTNSGLSLLQSAAQRNHAPALYNLGLIYEDGHGITADEKLALQYYKAAAMLEHPSATYNLAIFYGQGRAGLRKDTDTALRLLQIAASKGQQNAKAALEGLKSKTTAESPVATQQNLDSFVDSPTGRFLEMVGAINTNNRRTEELIY